MTARAGATYERRQHRVIEPTRHPGIDFSIPEKGDHAKHLADVLHASPGGFAWLERRP